MTLMQKVFLHEMCLKWDDCIIMQMNGCCQIGWNICGTEGMCITLNPAELLFIVLGSWYSSKWDRWKATYDIFVAQPTSILLDLELCVMCVHRYASVWKCMWLSRMCVVRAGHVREAAVDWITPNSPLWNGPPYWMERCLSGRVLALIWSQETQLSLSISMTSPASDKPNDLEEGGTGVRG